MQCSHISGLVPFFLFCQHEPDSPTNSDFFLDYFPHGIMSGLEINNLE